MTNVTTPPIPAPEKPGLPSRRGLRLGQTFAALKYPAFRLWFAGQLVSLVGTWMQSTAQGFLIYELTKDPFLLGAIGFAQGVPSLLTVFGGAVADRMPRRTLLIITQTVMMILAFILATLTFLGVVQAWHVFILAFLLGIANAFDAPARQAFVLEMVEREDLTNAIALNATMFNSATAVGPAAAGITYAILGPAWCFTINGATFIAVIIALVLMKLKPWVAPKHQASMFSEIMTGFRYVASSHVIRAIILQIGIVALFGLGFVNLFPAWAVEILKGDAATNGWLQSARGVGALIAALMIAYLAQYPRKGKMLTLGTLAFPILLLVFSFIRWLPLSLFILVGVGGAFVFIANLSNALVQNLVPDELRGRVMGVYTLIFFGFMPIGSLLAGEMANRIGEQPTVSISAAILVAFSILSYVLFPYIRAQK